MDNNNSKYSFISSLQLYFSKQQLGLIVLSGFFTGFLFQINYLSGKLVNNGILATFYKEIFRILAGSIGVAFFFLFFFAVFYVILMRIYKRDKLLQAFARLYFCFISFNLLGIYLLLKPNSFSFILPASLIVLSNVFYFKSRIIFRELADWLKRKNVLLAIAFISYFNLLPLFFLLFNNQIVDYFTVKNIILGSWLFLIPFIIFNNWSRLSLIVFFPLLYISSLFTIVHIYIYGNDLPQSTYYAIWETNPVEAFEFTGTYFNYVIAIISILHFIIPLLILYYIRNNSLYVKTALKKEFWTRVTIVGFLVVVIFSNECYKCDIINRYIFNYVGYKEELNKFNYEFKHRNLMALPVPQEVKNYDGNQTYVLIIGESLSRHHMSLYGYPRKTNPKLESIKNQIYVFNDVISPHSHTNPVLKEMLTFASKDNMKPFTENRSVMEYIKAAGYNTYWISNQQMFNEYTSVGTSIAMQSDWNYFTNSNEGDPKEAYDEKVLKPLDQILSNNVKKKFIVIHLLGNHGDYHNRYPEKFNHFTNWEGIVKNKYTSDYKVFMTNAYDNSILYNDSIIYTLISRIKSLNQNSFLIYLSDHGEEVYDYREFMGHGEANASIYMFDIPFIVWLSDKYKENNPQLTNYLPQIINRKYQTDDFEHSLYNLMNLSSAGYDPKKSIFNEEFVPKARYMLNFDYDELIKTKKSVTD